MFQLEKRLSEEVPLFELLTERFILKSGVKKLFSSFIFCLVHVTS